MHCGSQLAAVAHRMQSISHNNFAGRRSLEKLYGSEALFFVYEGIDAAESEHKDQIQCAELAKQELRYDDMAACIKVIIDSGAELTSEERNLMSVAYKNMVQDRLYTWRTYSALEQVTEGDDRPMPRRPVRRLKRS